MSDDVLKREVEKWINDSPGFLRRSVRGLAAFYHNKLPRQFRPLGAVHFTSKTAMASSAPGVAFYFYESISALTAIGASAAIFLGHSLVAFLDRVSKENRSEKSGDMTESIVRIGELLRLSAPASSAQAKRDDMVRSALGVIEDYVRQVTGAKPGEIGVAIALYEGTSSTKMRIRHRNIGNTRPTGKTFDGNGVLGHHACQNGTGPKIVHNVSRLHKVFK